MYVSQRQDLIARRANFFGNWKGTWYGEEMGLVGAAVDAAKTFLGEMVVCISTGCRSVVQRNNRGQGDRGDT